MTEEQLFHWMQHKVIEVWGENPFEVPTRAQPWARRRQMMMHVLRKKGLSYPAIARICGCTHGNVIHADKFMTHSLKYELDLRRDIDELMK